jgi:hypothetical protein
MKKLSNLINLLCFGWNVMSVILGSAILFTALACAWNGFDVVDSIPDGRLKIYIAVGALIGAITHFREELL